MGGKELKLLGTNVSPFCNRVEWALKLKGIEYELLEEDLMNKSPLLLQLNPVYKKVPVLMHGGKSISESLIILEYIDETWKEIPILPQDIQGRANIRFLAKFADDKLFPATHKAFFSAGEDQERAIESIAEVFQLLEGEIKGKKFFGGEKIGFLDFVVGWIAYWFRSAEEAGGLMILDSMKYPSLDSWTHNFLQLPLIKNNIPPPIELHRVSLALREKWLATLDASE